MESGTPDEILVVAAILGDLGAFDELALRYRPAVVRMAAAIVSRDDAEDVAQEALLLAFKALPSVEEPHKFAAWLRAITRRSAIRHSQRVRLRQRARVPLDEVILEQIPAISRPVKYEGLELRSALETIPQDYALALQLHFLDEMPLRRIAGFLGVSLATVKWRIYRGKILLRGQIGVLTGKGERWKGKRK